jgi:SAM-dependent methyltransferase
MTSSIDPLSGTLALRERVREMYWHRRDPIIDDRLLWRAQTFRHVMHILPGQSILEIGCGNGAFTRQLAKVTRCECPLTAITFDADSARPPKLPPNIEFVTSASMPGVLEGRCFDFVVAHDIIDKGNDAWLLKQIFTLLAPGGRVLFYESNPWNVVLRFRQRLGYLIGHRDQRLLLNRTDLYELVSELGFIRIFAVFNDFVYAPLTPRMIWFLRNVSIILENTPGLRTLAGSILLHAQKPPTPTPFPCVSFTIDEIF